MKTNSIRKHIFWYYSLTWKKNSWKHFTGKIPLQNNEKNPSFDMQKTVKKTLKILFSTSWKYTHETCSLYYSQQSRINNMWVRQQWREFSVKQGNNILLQLSNLNNYRLHYSAISKINLPNICCCEMGRKNLVNDQLNIFILYYIFTSL